MKRLIITYALCLLVVCALIVVFRIALGDYTVGRRLDTESLESMTREEVMRRARLMAEWYAMNQHEDGSLPYLYDPASEMYGPGDNMIRQFITAQGAYALARVFEDEALRDRASRHTDALFRLGYERVEEHSYAYIKESDGRVKLGAAALAILAAREGKGDDEPLSPDERSLGEFLLHMQRLDGSFQTFLHNATSTENDRFYSGEALTALARLYGVTNDERYAAALERSFPYYHAILTERFAPQYAPWHIQAYALAYSQTARAEYASYVFMLADRLIEEMLRKDTDALPDEEGRFYNARMRREWGPPHSSSTGIYVEGLTYAYDLARDMGDAERERTYRAAIVEGMRYLAQVQITADRADDQRVVGALKESVIDTDIRIDQTGHAMNAFARILSVLDHE